MTPVISIITPVFNRAKSMIDSVNSSLNFLQECGVHGEVVVVDDASTDDTNATASHVFAKQIELQIVRVLTLPINVGPTGAKQAGAVHSRGRWLIFMDSDDSFVAGASKTACIDLESVPGECPIVFFRCINKMNGQLIGAFQDSLIWLDLQSFLYRGTPGECLPAIRRDCLLTVPYSTDLRGFESLTYAELIQTFGPACVSPVILRNYCTDEDGERLSTRRAIRMRGCLIARGYLSMLSRFGLKLRGRIFSTMLRIFYHSSNCLISTISRKIGL